MNDANSNPCATCEYRLSDQNEAKRRQLELGLVAQKGSDDTKSFYKNIAQCGSYEKQLHTLFWRAKISSAYYSVRSQNAITYKQAAEEIFGNKKWIIAAVGIVAGAVFLVIASTNNIYISMAIYAICCILFTWSMINLKVGLDSMESCHKSIELEALSEEIKSKHSEAVKGTVIDV